MARPLSVRTLVLAFGFSLLASGMEAQGHASSADTVVTVVELSPKQGSLSDLLKAESAKAVKAGRTPFVEIGAEWCGQCRELKANLGDKRMIDAFAGTYIIRLDLDAWKPQLSPLGFAVDAIPVFFAVDTNGKATGANFTTDPLGANTPEHVAAPLQKFFHEHLKKNES